ncbi:MAG: MBL fold metallo-hydrolase [Ignavibacteria bacterium]|nr:MBL fold metallo-hydrolase [Ignavibacteria bacterium]
MKHDHIHWLGHASFWIDDAGTIIYIDPWKLPDTSPKADIVLITHPHFDHFSLDDIKDIQKQDTIVAGPAEVARQVHATALTVEPDKEYSVGKVSFRTVPAYNLGKEFHSKKEHWVGYVITLSSGQVIYHAGDTDPTPEMRRVACDVALLPCGGTYTMTAKEAADAANSMKVTAVIPMHWGDLVGSATDAQEFARIFKGETIIKQPEG